ncbi:hypothetical protein FNV65_40915 [Streptomyces sp. S1A1-8]|nr:hypothetical protein FNV58_42330 [Streptomyces sp. RLB1-9]QDO23467.1 hypothetical protein FNV65_40915 [Streptomyces sp. S1A1-8]QDO33593.1 hypothetical protein FNV63_40940 [Streptomyces sp. S1A1-3]
MARKSVRTCSQCGSPLPEGSRKSRRYCSAACRTKAWRWKRERKATGAHYPSDVAVGAVGAAIGLFAAALVHRAPRLARRLLP